MPPNPFHLSFDHLFGGFVGGHIFASILFGIITVQTYRYYRNFPQDGIISKIMIGVLWFVEAFSIVTVTTGLWNFLIIDIHYLARLASVSWQLEFFNFSTAIASVAVQSFFSWRIYALSTNIWLGVLLMMLVVCQFVLGMITNVKITITKEYSSIVTSDSWFIVAWLASEAFVDVVITAFMCFLLYKQRTGFKRTDSAITRMIVYTINTGALTSAAASLVFIVYMTSSWGHWPVPFVGMALGPFYILSVLANLHSRSSIRKGIYAQSSSKGISFPLSPISPPVPPPRHQFNSSVSDPVFDIHGGSSLNREASYHETSSTTSTTSTRHGGFAV